MVAFRKAALRNNLICLCLCLASALHSLAGHDIELESEYLGDGWFQYRLRTAPNPLWENASVTSLYVPFTNFLNYGVVPLQWETNIPTPALFGWEYKGGIAQTRPYERAFLIRSAATSYRTVGKVHVGFDLSPQPHVVSSNISKLFGYVRDLPCLVPCPPEQADNSPLRLSSTFQAAPDVRIEEMVFTPNQTQRLRFSTLPSTVLLQASYDLRDWTDLAYIVGHQPETIWLAPTNLTWFGRYFRLELVATVKRPDWEARGLLPTSTHSPPASGWSVARSRSH